MRRICLVISILASLFPTIAVHGQRQKARNWAATEYTYFTYSYDSDRRDTGRTVVIRLDKELLIYDKSSPDNPIPGYAYEPRYVDLLADSIYSFCHFSDDTVRFYIAVPLVRNDIRWDTQTADSKTVKYITSINSNRIELFFDTDGEADVSPLPYYGKFRGTLKKMVRNGLVQFELASKKGILYLESHLIPSDKGLRTTARELAAIKRDRMALTTHVFENEQLCWGKERPTLTDIPFDTTLHYAGGTVILKRLMLPKLPSHYQTFVELHQRSNGDAYDRTGSVFIIPQARNPIDNKLVPSFLDAMTGHPDSLPILVGKDGERYQGIVPGISRMQKYRLSSFHYYPPVELMRFFTPFGVGHFNDRVQIDGLEWKDETLYKQEVTELQPFLQGEVWIGVFIGNYDGGGHRVSLDIKSYPNDYEWSDDSSSADDITCTSLINTCNVLEMAGQNYGKIFGTDSLTVTFQVTEWDSVLTLRYISTGHGGWGGGDEFNPKENTICIDGEKRFSHTPWRCDCGRYREWNPVSGNFWNGLSSSDLSRSGWCPGTATQPVYFDLTGLAPGRHTLTVAIPQGPPMEGGFSHWNVSAVLISQRKQQKTNIE